VGGAAVVPAAWIVRTCLRAAAAGVAAVAIETADSDNKKKKHDLRLDCSGCIPTLTAARMPTEVLADVPLPLYFSRSIVVQVEDDHWQALPPPYCETNC
jgi:hypothetical protein